MADHRIVLDLHSPRCSGVPLSDTAYSARVKRETRLPTDSWLEQVRSFLKILIEYSG